MSLLRKIYATITGTGGEEISSVNNALRVSLCDGNGNIIKSMNNAINIHDADVHEVPINTFFFFRTTTTSTLSVAAPAGSTSITVVDASSFAVGNKILIEDGVNEATYPTITAISTNTITLDRPINNSFNIGDLVTKITIEMNVNGTLDSPISYKIMPDVGYTWHIEGFSLSLVHGSAADDSLFGNITALQNGVILRAYNGTLGKYRTFTNWKTNGDIGLDTGNIQYTDKAGGGKYGTSASGQIKNRSGAVPKITRNNGDFIEILIQDNLTSLNSFKIKAQGHIESI